MHWHTCDGRRRLACTRHAGRRNRKSNPTVLWGFGFTLRIGFEQSPQSTKGPVRTPSVHGYPKSAGATCHGTQGTNSRFELRAIAS